MANLNDIPPFPNSGVRLIKEDEKHVAIWEEVFEPGKPTPPHRHTRDCVAIFPNAGELTIIPVAGDSVAGEVEELTVVAGQMKESATANSGTRLVFSNGTVLHQNVPAGGSSHYAVNEGPKPDLMILIEIKGTSSEKKMK
jgi:hypothetical protein